MKEKDRRPFKNGKTKVYTGNAHNNHIDVTGNVGNHRDNFKTKTTKNGLKVVNFTMCTEYTYYDSNKKLQTINDWHSVACFGPLAETAEVILRTGRTVRVIGRQTKNPYTREMEVTYPNGKKGPATVTTLESRIICSKLQGLGNVFDINYGVEEEQQNNAYSNSQNQYNQPPTNSYAEEDMPGIPYDGGW